MSFFDIFKSLGDWIYFFGTSWQGWVVFGIIALILIGLILWAFGISIFGLFTGQVKFDPLGVVQL